MSNKAQLELKLSAARTKLIIDKPFLGALVLRLPLVAADPSWCHTTATDARSFFYNPEYIASLSVSQTQFILAHEALHCALSHFARRQHRQKQRWDIACDFAINPLLTQDGLIPPPGALLEQSYEGLTAEEIYPYILENSEELTLDKHVYDSDSESGENPESHNGAGSGMREQELDSKSDNSQPNNSPSDESSAKKEQHDNNSLDNRKPKPSQGETGAAQPQPLTEQERDELKIQWQQRMAGAAQQAMQAGKMGADMQRLIDHLLQPQLPWRSLLTHYVSCVARDDYSYARPNNRRGGPAIFPSLRSEEIDIAVILDTSGSIADEEIQTFLSEINAIKSHLRARIIFHTCDAELCVDGPWEFESWQDFDLPTFLVGGGATDFRPAFRWLDGMDRAPQLVVYFTDAEGDFPEQEPHYPVIWLVQGKATVPWGQRVQLN